MCSERPEYNDKIIMAEMLAPSIYQNPMPSTFLKFTSLVLEPLELVDKVLQNREIYKNVSKFMIYQITQYTSKTLCDYMLYYITQSDQTDEVSLGVKCIHLHL